MNQKTSRRNLLKKLAAGSIATAAFGPISCIASDDSKKDRPLKGNIQHSVCQWTYSDLSIEELCIEAKKIGIKAIDLIAPKDWPILKKHGLHCSMCYIAGKVSLTDGWGETKFHEQLIRDYREAIPLVAEAGYTNLICFSGNRRGMDDQTGLDNCVKGLKEILPLAEKHGVVIQMELLNSKVDHKDYMCDHTAWGVELCKRLGSDNFKLLYDIYHMQVDEGDVIHTIRTHHSYIGHYHTAGVPGRNEINDNQELYYPAIMRAILATGFKGHVAQEFMSTGKTKEARIAALKEAVMICDV
jgi:hydroxypyruvate isomerase